MCEKHRILRIFYHIPSKCGIPIFKFFQKTGHSRSSKRNTQYARPCKRRERAKRMNELQCMMNNRVRDLQETALFEMLASKDPELKAMLDEYKTLRGC